MSFPPWPFLWLNSLLVTNVLALWLFLAGVTAHCSFHYIFKTPSHPTCTEQPSIDKDWMEPGGSFSHSYINIINSLLTLTLPQLTKISLSNREWGIIIQPLAMALKEFRSHPCVNLYVQSKRESFLSSDPGPIAFSALQKYLLHRSWTEVEDPDRWPAHPWKETHFTQQLLLPSMESLWVTLLEFSRTCFRSSFQDRLE